MGDSTPIKGRCLKVVNQHNPMRWIIKPDAVMYTKNVMVPIIKPVSVKQTYDTPSLENRRQILRAQNYTNNPALFSETPLHTLYNPLENLLEVNQKLCNSKDSFAFLCFIMHIL